MTPPPRSYRNKVVSVCERILTDSRLKIAKISLIIYEKHMIYVCFINKFKFIFIYFLNCFKLFFTENEVLK